MFDIQAGRDKALDDLGREIGDVIDRGYEPCGLWNILIKLKIIALTPTNLSIQINPMMKNPDAAQQAKAGSDV